MPRRPASPPQPRLDLYDVLELGTRRALEVWLDLTPDPRTRADQIGALTDDQVRALVDLLDPAATAAVFGPLEPHVAAEVLQVLPAPVAAGVVDSLEPDDAATLLRALSATQRADVLAAMPVSRSAVVRGLLAWPPDSAAAQMNPEVATVGPTLTVREAIATLRSQPASTADTAEVWVTNGPALLGVLTYRELVRADPGLLVAELMREDVITVGPGEDQEVAAQLLHDHRLSALPVVADGHLLGVLTAEDVAEITEQETTEDAERQGGASPLEVPYLRASPLLLWRKRIGWLLVLFVTATITSSVLQYYEDELETVIALALFVPLLIGAGGNAGTQITATLIRAMATGGVALRDAGRVLRKELTTGVLVAATIALIGWLRAWTLGVGGEVALTVAVAAGAIIVWSSVIASVLPLVLRSLRLDPAVGSGPVITTLVDGTGLVIYFTVAGWFISALGA